MACRGYARRAVTLHALATLLEASTPARPGPSASTIQVTEKCESVSNRWSSQASVALCGRRWPWRSVVLATRTLTV